MILTEEQREAIRAVSKLPVAIGCSKCHNYIQKNYSDQFAILQAMIDSSDHIVEPDELIGFDLERARGLRDFLQDDCAEVGDVWAEMIAEIERLQLELTQALKDLSSKDEIIEKLKKEFLKSAYERNKIHHGHAWYPGDEDYNEYLQRIDADAHKKSQESLDDVLRGD